MKIGVVFHKDPLAAPDSIDLIRLRAITKGLNASGVETEILAPVPDVVRTDGGVIVRPVAQLQRMDYDLVKTCYHFSIDLASGFDGPIVARIVRVADDRLPERDGAARAELLRLQAIIASRAACVVVNNPANARRWRHLYGSRIPVVCVPTGCPARIPQPAERNPFESGKKTILFLGSLAAVRMISIINELARRCHDVAQVHIIGLDKTHLYGQNKRLTLDPVVVNHGPMRETDIWAYIHHAHLGLAIATGPHPFDNDLSKVWSYLRGGLPVLSESPVLNNPLVRKTGMGLVFRYADMEDMATKARRLLDAPPLANKQAAMRLMIEKHSWDCRVKAYIGLFHALHDGVPVSARFGYHPV
ncbi:hypothetical protein [Desulfatirhabdium butyrativorans]|uniref:hypothetical protein n=1 Tax=Desulfatirhabdium butyrativorans TaxID=340467 RepID=UPI0003FDA6C0|nr:hypothetical protein [Desulfatirhabdium butyrativorans]